jgi:hypothetical protein
LTAILTDQVGLLYVVFHVGLFADPSTPHCKNYLPPLKCTARSLYIVGEGNSERCFEPIKMNDLIGSKHSSCEQVQQQ